MECPVCKTGGITEFMTFCPSCKSDLVFFSLVDQVEEEFNKELKGRIAKDGDYMMLKKQYESETSNLKSKMSQRVLALLCLPFLTLVCGRNEPQKIIVQSSRTTDSLTIVKMNNELAILKTELNELKTPKFILHTIQKGETLEDISLQYYKDKISAKKIAQENGLMDKKQRRRLKPGNILKITIDKK